MLAGVLEIQMMANMSRLAKDMGEARRIVGDATDKMRASVNSLKSSLNSLGVGVSIGLIADAARRATDSYTKLDSQLQLSTKSQQEYNIALADVRRISSIAQTDINETTMLYTRLMNVMDGTGVEQSKLATVTETVAYGLKAYGATAAEAASAALQLSQAFGANRLGGEEFRAVMEAAPNLMKVLAKSMDVPLGGLRQLSIEGKITADAMIKAFGDPAVAEEFKRLAQNTQTVTGAFVVAKNELTMLFGEFSKASGATGALMAILSAIAGLFRILGTYLNDLIAALAVYAGVLTTKVVVAMVRAKLEQMALNAAHAEALAMNLAIAQAEARNALLARDTAAARAFQTGITNGLAAANARLAAANAELAAAQAAMNASTVSFMSRIKAFVSANKYGIIGLALWGAYEIADHLGWIDMIFSSATKRVNDFQSKLDGMTLEEAYKERHKLQVLLKEENNSWMRNGELVSEYAQKISLLTRTINRLEEAKKKANEDAKNPLSSVVNYDQLYINNKYAELSAQLESGRLSWEKFKKGIKNMYRDLYGETKNGVGTAKTSAMSDIDRVLKEYETIHEAAMKGQHSEEELAVYAYASKLNQLEREYEAARAHGVRVEELDAGFAQAKIDLEQKTLDEIARIRYEAETRRINELTGFAKMTALLRRNDLKGALDTAVMMTSGLAQHSRAFFNLNKAASIATTTVKGYEAAQKAFAEGGPFLGPILAAASIAFTAAQIAGINATTFGGGGGSTPSVPSMSGAASYNAAPRDITPVSQQQQQTIQVTIYNQGNVLSNDFVMETIIPQIRNAVSNSDVLIIDPRSAQAAVLGAA